MTRSVGVDLPRANLHALITLIAASNPADDCASGVERGDAHAACRIAVVYLHGSAKGRAAIVGKSDLDFGLVVGGGEPGYGHVIFVGSNGRTVDRAGVDLPVVGENVLGLRPFVSVEADHRNIADFLIGAVAVGGQNAI